MKFEEFDTQAEPYVSTPPNLNVYSTGLGQELTVNSHPVPNSGIQGSPSYDPSLIRSSFGADALIGPSGQSGLSGGQPNAGTPSGPAWDENPIKGGL